MAVAADSCPQAKVPIRLESSPYGWNQWFCQQWLGRQDDPPCRRPGGRHGWIDQYSSGSRMQVELRSASVIIHILTPKDVS
jgi:hypothetical protein